MIRLATPAYNALEHRLPSRIIQMLNHLSTSQPNTTEKSLWRSLLTQMGVNTLIYSILSTAIIATLFTFLLPFTRRLLPGWELHWYANAITGVITVLCISPFLRAMVMKKNHSEEWKTLWSESNRNRVPLLFTVLVRFIIAVNFIFYICNYLTRFSSAVMITLGIVAVVLMVASRSVKHRSILLERLFINNLRSRDIEAQVRGKKRPLYEGKLLDRDIHIADFEVPSNSMWMGSTLKQLNLGRKYGVHVSSILRGGRRLNIPDGDYVIFPGDHLQVIGSDEQLAKLGEVLNSNVFSAEEDIEKREMKLRQLIISADSPFVGKTLEESGIRSLYSCMVVGLEEGKENLSAVKPQRRFEEGDIIWVVGEVESLEALLNK
jgi:CPA2 family monovalent cation:H+ antiporter-2